MDGLKALIPALKVSDDYGVQTTCLRKLPIAGGNMLLSFSSYARVKAERDAEGMKTPLWLDLQLYYLNGEYK
jgi:hypothetical protein